MGLFDGLRKAAVSIHTKRQSQYYRKLRRDTRKAKLEREKLRMVRQAGHEKTRTKTSLKKLRPQRRLRLVGNLNEFAKGIPSDAELNKALFGAPTPKRPSTKDVSK